MDVGFVFQDDVLWLDRTVDDNLKFIGTFSGMKHAQMVERMKFLKRLLFLEPHSNKRARDLSGGNKRKLSCAMALLIPPKILFLDEISNGVDPVARKNLYSYLHSLTHTTKFLITHRIDETEKICDEVAILVEGQIRDQGTPESLKDRHGNLFLLHLDVNI